MMVRQRVYQCRRLRFEIFRPLQSGLPYPEATGAFGLGTVPSGKLAQQITARRAVFFAQRCRQRPKITDHASLLAWKAMIATPPEPRDNTGH